MNNDVIGKVLNNYDGVLGKALLERRTGVNGSCNQYDSLGLCSIMDCLYCENCYYKITLDTGEAIANSNVELKEIDDKSRGLMDDDYEIFFYDFVPEVDDLFGYLFDDNSQFRMIRKCDSIVMVDNVQSRKKLLKKNNSRIAD